MARVLIVDDERFIRESFSRILAGEGYEISTASTGEEALDIMQQKNLKPDAIILDLRMPGIDGVEVCRRVRSNEDTRKIPIVVVTAHALDKENALKAGADDFLNKPVDDIDVILRIKYILKIRQLTEELESTKAYLEELKKTGKGW